MTKEEASPPSPESHFHTLHKAGASKIKIYFFLGNESTSVRQKYTAQPALCPLPSSVSHLIWQSTHKDNQCGLGLARLCSMPGATACTHEWLGAHKPTMALGSWPSMGAYHPQCSLGIPPNAQQSGQGPASTTGSLAGSYLRQPHPHQAACRG